MFTKNISFLPNAEKDTILLSPEDIYCDSVGYGFIYFAPLHHTKSGVEVREKGFPLHFRVAVPETGVYAVTISVEGGEQGLTGLNIYSGRRNMVRRDIAIRPGETFTCQYFVHVCDYIDTMGQPPRQDLSVHISVLGDIARISTVTIEKSEAPTLFIGGDSIVADYEACYPYNPLTNGGSWAQNMLQYVEGMAIDNQAHGGMTTNSFRDDGHWDIVCKNIEPGDIFMFQFGHNDQKRRNLAPFSGYSANLRWYVHKVRSMGATPIIVTSLSRIPSQDENGFYDLLEDYAEACRRVGREWNVPVIDLHQYSFDLFCKMEEDVLKGYFNDASHTNDYGAMKMSAFIASEIKNKQIAPLWDHMNDYFPAPWYPDESLRPEKPILSIDLPNLPYADCIHIKQLDGLKQAMAKGLLDPCLKFYHPFDEMPRGQFLFLFFKAAKAPVKRSYQGKYCDIYKYEFDASNVQAAIDAELIDETTTLFDRFRPDDGLTGGELLSFIVRSLHDLGDRDYNIPECEQQAKGLGLIWEGYQRDGKVNRADCTVALVRMMDITSSQIRALPRKRKNSEKQ